MDMSSDEIIDSLDIRFESDKRYYLKIFSAEVSKENGKVIIKSKNMAFSTDHELELENNEMVSLINHLTLTYVCVNGYVIHDAVSTFSWGEFEKVLSLTKKYKIVITYYDDLGESHKDEPNFFNLFDTKEEAFMAALNCAEQTSNTLNGSCVTQGVFSIPEDELYNAKDEIKICCCFNENTEVVTKYNLIMVPPYDEDEPTVWYALRLCCREEKQIEAANHLMFNGYKCFYYKDMLFIPESEYDFTRTILDDRNIEYIILQKILHFFPKITFFDNLRKNIFTFENFVTFFQKFCHI